MEILSQEVDNIQNPALGAALIWQFSVGYLEGHRLSEGTPLPLVYIIFPLIFHSDTYGHLVSTQKRSGLRFFVNKFLDKKNSQSDLIYSVQDRVIDFLPLTQEAFQLAIVSHLIVLSLETAVIFPTTTTPRGFGVAEEVDQLMKSSEKLGFWCAQNTLHEIATILKLRF